MFDYQKENRFFAQISGGMEELGASELKELGAFKVKPEFRGITFSADRKNLYQIVYKSRLVSRIIAPLKTFQCHDYDDLYRTARRVSWEKILSPSLTFAIFSNVANSKIDHSHYASLKLKDSIADYFVDKFGERPDIDTREPDVWLNLHIHNNQATLGFDVSGGSLHKRGYRKNKVSAPIQETLAAAIIRISGWDRKSPLYDPMCGSGTILAEAVMSAADIPAAALRDFFGFYFMPDYDDSLWEQIKATENNKIRQIPSNLISGSDISGEAVKISRENLALLPMDYKVPLKTIDFKDAKPQEGATIITNPPYGIRMTEKGGMEAFYKRLGDFLKQKCKGSNAYIYFGERELIKHIGLKATWKKPLKNGGLDGRLVKYEMY